VVGLGVRRATLLAPSALYHLPQEPKDFSNSSYFAAWLRPRLETYGPQLSIAHYDPTGLAVYKQSTWDKPVSTSERLDLTNSLSVLRWPSTAVDGNISSHALTLSGCGLSIRLGDRAAYTRSDGSLIVVCANICESHRYPCGASVDAKGSGGGRGPRLSIVCARNFLAKNLVFSRRKLALILLCRTRYVLLYIKTPILEFEICFLLSVLCENNA